MARLFTVASDDTLIEMIGNATERLVIVAPSLSQTVAEALVVRLQDDGGPIDLSVTLDTDPEICRLGYGDIEPLELLRPALVSRKRVLQTQSGVRIGLVVADADILVYSPTPQLIEEGSTSDEKPNAIRITGAGPEELAFACGASETSVLGHIQEVGLHSVTEEAVVQARVDLEVNPPRKFDLVRLETVFNYKLEFVELSIEGYRLNARVVTLPPIILGFVEKDLKERLRNTIRLFEGGVPFTFTIPDPDDDSVALEVQEKWFADEARDLREYYFISLGSSSYGNLIQKRLKPEFLHKRRFGDEVDRRNQKGTIQTGRRECDPLACAAIVQSIRTPRLCRSCFQQRMAHRNPTAEAPQIVEEIWKTHTAATSATA